MLNYTFLARFKTSDIELLGLCDRRNLQVEAKRPFARE